MIEIIVSHLDSYSVGQLMKTCTYLDGVCQSFLHSKGIVEVQWQKVCYKGTTTWKISGQNIFIYLVLAKN